MFLMVVTLNLPVLRYTSPACESKHRYFHKTENGLNGAKPCDYFSAGGMKDAKSQIDVVIGIEGIVRQGFSDLFKSGNVSS
jgi:hypothetical protein